MLLGFFFQAYELEQFHHAVADFLLGLAANAEAERHVFKDGHVAKKCVVLEDEPDVPILRGLIRDVVGFVVNGAGVGNFEAGDDAEQGGLAGTRRSEQRDEFPSRALDRDAIERGEGTEPLRDVTSRDAHANPKTTGNESALHRGGNRIVELTAGHRGVFLLGSHENEKAQFVKRIFRKLVERRPHFRCRRDFVFPRKFGSMTRMRTEYGVWR